MIPKERPAQRFWYLVYCKPRQEQVANENLMRQGYETYVPMMNTRRRRRGHYINIIEPMFPRYLFVHLNSVTDNWAPINSTLGVSGIVRFGMEPAYVPDDLVFGLQQRDDENGVQNLPLPEFHQGDKIRIVDGAMQGYEGIFVAKTSQERSIILLEIVGKAAKIQLSDSLIEIVK